MRPPRMSRRSTWAGSTGMTKVLLDTGTARRMLRRRGVGACSWYSRMRHSAPLSDIQKRSHTLEVDDNHLWLSCNPKRPHRRPHLDVGKCESDLDPDLSMGLLEDFASDRHGVSGRSTLFVQAVMPAPALGRARPHQPEVLRIAPSRDLQVGLQRDRQRITHDEGAGSLDITTCRSPGSGLRGTVSMTVLMRNHVPST